MDRREFVDMMLSQTDPYHQPTTMMGNWAKQAADRVRGRPVTADLSSGHGARDFGPSYVADAPGGGPPVPLSPSLLDQFSEGVVSMAKWLVQHVWPMERLIEEGVKLADSGRRWKLNGPVALLGGFLLPALALGSTPVLPAVGSVAVAVAGTNAPIAVFAVGAILGYFTIPTLGLALAMTVMLLAVAIVLAAMAFVVVIGYRALDAWLSATPP
jgi:hypothetical protein